MARLTGVGDRPGGLLVQLPFQDEWDTADGLYRFVSRRLFRPVGLAPEEATQATTARINETIDGSVFRWRADAAYRPQNLAAWAKAKNVDPAKFAGAIRATDPSVSVP